MRTFDKHILRCTKCNESFNVDDYIEKINKSFDIDITRLDVF